MKITTKENANGKISAYYVDGAKVRKNEVEGLLEYAYLKDEVITIDYYVAQNFKVITCGYRAMKVVFAGMGENLMTEAAAEHFGYKITGKFSGSIHGVYRVEKNAANNVETGNGNTPADNTQEAENAPAEVTAQETDNDDDNVWELIPELDDLNDVDTATAETESASKTAEPAHADDFAAKLAELKAIADNAKRALAKAHADCNKANAVLKNFIDEQAYNLKQKLDALNLDYTITLKKENGATYRVKNFDDIYIGAYRPGFDVEFHFELWNGKTLARYETLAQVEAVIARLKEAIARDDEQFTFPTIDDLKPPTFEIVPDAEWSGISGDHFYRIGEEYLTFDKAGRFVEVFNRELGGYYTRKGEFYYKNKSDNPDAIWEGNRHKCDAELFYRIMTLRADDNLEESPDAVQVANDYQKTLDTVKAQIAADNFDYVAAKEHIEDVYENIQNCIEYWGYYYGLTQKQSEKIYVTLHANADFDNIDKNLRDKLVADAQNANSLTRAMEIALEKFQDFCKLGNLPAANRELACYQICRSAFKEVITYDRSGVSATAGRTA